MSSRYQSGEEGVVFLIYTCTKDRKFCVSIGSMIFSQSYLCSYDPCELSMMLCFFVEANMQNFEDILLYFAITNDSAARQ